MPRRTRTRIRRRPTRPTPPRRLFEGLLSLLILGVAFEWTQGSEPESWYATRDTESVESDRWAFGIRSADDPLFRADAWHLPLDDGTSDPVVVCSSAVAELWAGTAADLQTARAGGDAVCALPLPGRWTTPGSASTTHTADVLAKTVPTTKPAAPVAMASRISPHSAAAALASGSTPGKWSAGPTRPAEQIASIAEDDR